MQYDWSRSNYTDLSVLLLQFCTAYFLSLLYTGISYPALWISHVHNVFNTSVRFSVYFLLPCLRANITDLKWTLNYYFIMNNTIMGFLQFQYDQIIMSCISHSHKCLQISNFPVHIASFSLSKPCAEPLLHKCLTDIFHTGGPSRATAVL